MTVASVPVRSPWGKVQQTSVYADGIVFVSTASHGGFKLSRSRQAQMPEALRIQGGWYEEDCEAALVVLGLSKHFSNEQLIRATESVKNWFPDKYEQWTGIEIPVEQSLVKKNRKFEADNADNYVVISAWGDWHQKVPKGMVAVLANKGGNRNSNDTKWFLVPANEYHGNFVIDLKKHQEIVDIGIKTMNDTLSTVTKAVQEMAQMLAND